ncbi:hypothetical protein BpHYR1_041628 [Brachionus plicatilis]|uniref:Uncharacterized protein n=1 Tax=Brachionus plicatilis TaxID=10195 RepID=A0A3M7SSW9_BRAPC|nr:hypothetical protein BpHYR1_041628 [Brachionus plicatilis]
MDYEEFVNFRSQFYFYCGKEFFLKEFGKKPDKERPIPRNHVVLCEMIKKRGAKVPDFYGYYNLWRSCDENVYVEYDREEKRFLFQKKFNDNLKNDELYDFVNYKISSFDGASQRFGKSVKFFKYLCAFTGTGHNLEKKNSRK